jgi:hypothetical protein
LQRVLSVRLAAVDARCVLTWTLITRVPKVQAEALKIEMEAFGAAIELQASTGSPGAPTDLI